MRFIPAVPLTLPGVSTQRSRGRESNVTVLAAGSKRATIVTSLRCPPASASLPKALTWVEFETKARESEPTRRRLKGWPGGAAATSWLAWVFLILFKREVAEKERPPT